MTPPADEIDFLASVTHDLKSPLNAILWTLDAIKLSINSDNIDPAEILPNLAIAERAGKDMLELVSNMITTARLQTGNVTASPTLIDHHELADRARNMEKTFHNEALGKQIDFSVAVGRLPNFVYWDIQKIRFFAINNLISNALKFVCAGGSVKVLIDCDEQDNVLISVMDDGPGIPVSERAGVFERFVQASNNARSFQGGGFGLFNAHQTITMHKGNIEILDGLNGKGVTFRVCIPAVPFELESAYLFNRTPTTA